MSYKDRELESYKNKLIDNDIATSDEIELVCAFVGYSKRTLDRIVNVRTNYQNLKDYLDNR